LCLLLTESIDDPGMRSQFVDTFTNGGSEPRAGGTSLLGKRSGPGATRQSLPGAQTTSAPGTSSGGVPLDAAFVDQVTARLAFYVGPIARIIAKNAAQKAKTRSEFVALVAENLGTQDRGAFLGEMGYGNLQ
jgi:hypothetical protein